MQKILLKLGMCSIAGVVCLLSGCSSTGGTGALGAFSEAVMGSSSAAASQRRVDLQADIKAYENTQSAVHAESELAYLNVIKSMQTNGLWFASLAHIDALEMDWGISETSQLLRANALRHAGHKVNSTALYQQLLSGAERAHALHGLGLLAASDQQFEQAIDQFRQAQKLLPTNALLLNDLGYALLHTQHALEAEMPLMQAAQLEVGNTKIQSNVALYLVMFKSAQEAVAWMDQFNMGREQRMKILAHARTLAHEYQNQHAPLDEPSLLVGNVSVFETKVAGRN